MTCLLRVSALVCVGLTTAPLAQQHQHPTGDRLGTVKFETSCGASAADPYWGIAMARWSNPFTANIRPAAQVNQGMDAITSARKTGTPTAREHAHIEAVAALYADAETRDQRTRVLAYEKAMAALAAASLTTSALPTDKTYTNQLKAGAILEGLFPGQTDHPGITHCIIHSYDVPAHVICPSVG
jgi:hypothetical protein